MSVDESSQPRDAQPACGKLPENVWIRAKWPQGLARRTLVFISRIGEKGPSGIIPMLLKMCFHRILKFASFFLRAVKLIHFCWMQQAAGRAR